MNHNCRSRLHECPKNSQFQNDFINENGIQDKVEKWCQIPYILHLGKLIVVLYNAEHPSVYWSLTGFSSIDTAAVRLILFSNDHRKVHIVASEPHITHAMEALTLPLSRTAHKDHGRFIHLWREALRCRNRTHPPVGRNVMIS